MGFALAFALPAGAQAACLASIQSIAPIPDVLYDPFDGVARSVTFGVVVRNNGTEACNLGLAVASTNSAAPGSTRLFKQGAANSIGYVVETPGGTAYVNNIDVPLGSIALPAPLGSTATVNVKVKIPAGLIAPATSPYSDLFLFRLFQNGNPTALDNKTATGRAIIEARAQVNIAGTGATSYGSGFGVDKMDFKTLEPGESKSASVQVRATRPVSIRISSENRGMLEHKVLHSAKVPYTMTLGTANVVFSSVPFTFSDIPPVSLAGIAYPMTITIVDTASKPAGEYEDTLTITVSPQ